MQRKRLTFLNKIKHFGHWILDRASKTRKLLARYDAAQTTIENRNHWAAADYLSANAAHNPAVLNTLRARSRYEVANNTYARGLVDTLANYVVGTGARLQMLTEDEELNDKIETLWQSWATSINLAEKIRLMRISQTESGEVFGLMINNPVLEGPVKLDLVVIEADQITTPFGNSDWDSFSVDGIRFDVFGNPISYTMMRRHPGDMLFFPDDYVSVPRKYMTHLHRKTRPGQARGIPELTPALPLFALLRRYTLAVLNAAEQAALFTGVIHTDGSPTSEESITDVEELEDVPLTRGSLLTLPFGWKASQMKAEQPTTMYGEFKREVLAEIARCLNIPFNIAAGNSSEYNYASGRLDHQSFFRFMKIARAEIVSLVLDRLFGLWYEEAVLTGEFPALADRATPVHQWFWDGFEHVDPQKEASAQQLRLSNRTTSLAAEYASQGRDWRAEILQFAKEQRFLESVGLVPKQNAKNVDVVKKSGVENEESPDGEEGEGI